MRTLISRWFLFGLLLGWALTHATVFGQDAEKPPKSPAPVEELRASLDKAVTLDFTGQSLTDVIAHFRDKTGISIQVDPAALQMDANFGAFPPNGAPMQVQIQLKANNEKASQVLRKLLNAYQLAYVICEDSVLITTEEAALTRQMRLRVSVDLEDVPFNKAVRSLAKKHGINLVIDPKVAKQAETEVSLQLDNTGIETAVRLLAELADLKAARIGNALFITTEEKAAKLRDEEFIQQQFDNPLNANPPVGPAILRGVPAIGFGGIGMPAPAPAPMKVAPPAFENPFPPINPPPPDVQRSAAPPPPPLPPSRQ